MKSTFLDTRYKESINTVKQAAYNLGFELEEQDLRNGILIYSKEANLLSFGNDIEVRIYQRDVKTKIEVDSQSSAPFQIFDWGRNTNITESLISEIIRIAKR